MKRIPGRLPPQSLECHRRNTPRERERSQDPEDAFGWPIALASAPPANRGAPFGHGSTQSRGGKMQAQAMMPNPASQQQDAARRGNQLPWPATKFHTMLAPASERGAPLRSKANLQRCHHCTEETHELFSAFVSCLLFPPLSFLDLSPADGLQTCTERHTAP
jgi:hypothetical protein